LTFLIYLRDGGDCRSSYVSGNTSAYKWARKYRVIIVGEQESTVLVICPNKKKNQGVLHLSATRLEDLQKSTYAERLFADLWKIHQDDHCKGLSFFNRVRDRHGTITREVYKMFTDVCPHCIIVLSRRKPSAEIKNIVTDGFGVFGQADIIDFPRVCPMGWDIQVPLEQYRSWGEEVDIDPTC
jgi:hypothetical protein